MTSIDEEKQPAYGLFGPGIFGSGIDLSALDEDTAWRLGQFFGEQLKATAVAAEERGRQQMIAALGDDEAHAAFALSRLGRWMAEDLAAGRGPTGWNGRELRAWYARYLEHVAKEMSGDA